MNAPLVIDMDDVQGEAEEKPLCIRCESRHCIVVDPDGTWVVSLLHDARCPKMLPPSLRPRLMSIPGGAA